MQEKMGENKPNIEVEENKKWLNPLLFLVIASSFYFTMFWFIVWPITVHALRDYYYANKTSPKDYWPWYWMTLFWFLALIIWSLPLCICVYVCAARYRRKVCSYERKITRNVEVPAPPYPTQLCLIQPASPEESSSKLPLPTSFPAVAVKNGQSPYRMSDNSQMEQKLSSSSSSSSLAKRMSQKDVSTRALYGGSTQEHLSILKKGSRSSEDTNSNSENRNSTSQNELQQSSFDIIIPKAPPSSKENVSTTSLSEDISALIDKEFSEQCKKSTSSSSSSSSPSELSHNVDSVSSKKSDSLEEIQQIQDISPDDQDIDETESVTEEDKNTTQDQTNSESEQKTCDSDNQDEDDDVFTPGLTEDEPRNSKLSEFNEFLHLVPLSPCETTEASITIEKETKPPLKRQTSSQSEYFIASAYNKPSVTSEVFIAISGDNESQVEIEKNKIPEEVVFVGNIETSFKRVQ